MQPGDSSCVITFQRANQTIETTSSEPQVLNVPRLEEALSEVEKISARLLKSRQVILLLQVIIIGIVITAGFDDFPVTMTADFCAAVLVLEGPAPVARSASSYCHVHL